MKEKDKKDGELKEELAALRARVAQLQASELRLKLIEENLRIVDGAIREVHRAAEEDPGRAVEEQMVTHLYRTRFELLRQAVRLASREGEEKQS